MAKAIRIDSFRYKGKDHTVRIQRTGDTMPQPARIIVTYNYWDDTGGWRGWESCSMYDRTFEDWKYAHAVYNEILKRGKRQDDHTEKKDKR